MGLGIPPLPLFPLRSFVVSDFRSNSPVSSSYILILSLGKVVATGGIFR